MSGLWALGLRVRGTRLESFVSKSEQSVNGLGFRV